MRARIVSLGSLGLAIVVVMLNTGATVPAAPDVSNPVGHWRGVWMSTMDLELFGPVDVEVTDQRGLRVMGSIEWSDASGMMATWDFDGTTSAACIFTYKARGTGATEGTDLLLHGMHEPSTLMGTYSLFSPGKLDEGPIFLVKDFNDPGAPNLVGNWTGRYSGLLGEGSLGLAVEMQEAGNFEGMVQVENTVLPQFGRLLEFDLRGTVRDDHMGFIVGVGPTGLFMAEGMYTGPRDPMFAGTYHVFYANGLEGQGTFEVEMTDLIERIDP